MTSSSGPGNQPIIAPASEGQPQLGVFSPSSSVTMHELLSAIVNSSDDAIVSKNLNGIITSWNKGAERIFGYTAEEVVGKPITIVIPDDRLDEEPTILNRLKRGERVDHFETIRRRNDGSLIHISLTISPIRDETGKIVGASKIARDITLQKQAEIAIKESEERLRNLNAELERRVEERTAHLLAAIERLNGFTYSVAHDLRQSIRSMVVNAQMILEDHRHLINEDVQENLNRLATTGKEMSQLVDDLLRYARISNQEPRREPLDMTALALGIAAESKTAYPEAQITIQEGLNVVADRALVQMLLLNLMDNARKYGPKDEAPVIEVGGEGEVFYVRDNGIGFDQKYAERIFQPFERLHGGGVYAGTGIGLANAKRIAEKHGGDIWAESRPGEGSTFYFTLNAAPEEG